VLFVFLLLCSVGCFVRTMKSSLAKVAEKVINDLLVVDSSSADKGLVKEALFIHKVLFID
ncbi:hypothetical protein L195_g046744, partial [Trifolium pratense]